ncbi:hypothetical protein GCM10025868_19570 [Angustibacter aerolatus]|uniref:Ig-like domain-containing protein n=1 Tax=Angustibacter aerolatus TaxID=1162965 RepID=A0ABQ6JG00_9ACTN|nr:hypothetical protein GCM10025868_19570 [Angustibacter aerolatus]
MVAVAVTVCALLAPGGGGAEDVDPAVRVAAPLPAGADGVLSVRVPHALLGPTSGLPRAVAVGAGAHFEVLVWVAGGEERPRLTTVAHGGTLRCSGNVRAGRTTTVACTLRPRQGASRVDAALVVASGRAGTVLPLPAVRVTSG